MKHEEQQGFVLLAEGSCEQSWFFFCKMFELSQRSVGFHFCTCVVYILFSSVFWLVGLYSDNLLFLFYCSLNVPGCKMIPSSYEYFCKCYISLRTFLRCAQRFCGTLLVSVRETWSLNVSREPVWCWNRFSTCVFNPHLVWSWLFAFKLFPNECLFFSTLCLYTAVWHHPPSVL